jgi:hypothetical protein
MSQWIKHRGLFRPVGNFVEVEVQTIRGAYKKSIANDVWWLFVKQYRILNDVVSGEWKRAKGYMPVPHDTIVEVHKGGDVKWDIGRAEGFKWSRETESHVKWWRIAEGFVEVRQCKADDLVVSYCWGEPKVCRVFEKTIRENGSMLVKPVIQKEEALRGIEL